MELSEEWTRLLAEMDEAPPFDSSGAEETWAAVVTLAREMAGSVPTHIVRPLLVNVRRAIRDMSNEIEGALWKGAMEG